MAKKQSFWGRFSEWQNYAHYLLNGILITIYYFVWGNFSKTPFQMFIELSIVILVTDSIVHFIFWNLPEEYGRWRD